MAKYVYPAVFTPDNEVGGYCISFPDVAGCVSQADTLTEAIEMAQDALCLMLYGFEQDGVTMPEASAATSISHAPDEIVTLICCDTLQYRKFFDSKAVKKTLSIPSWLNDMAERNNVNFSSVLQTALKQQLHIAE